MHTLIPTHSARNIKQTAIPTNSCCSSGQFGAVRFRFAWLGQAHKGKNYNKLLTTGEMNFSAKMTNVRQNDRLTDQCKTLYAAFKLDAGLFSVSPSEKRKHNAYLNKQHGNLLTKVLINQTDLRNRKNSVAFRSGVDIKETTCF